jgi:uncharacterized protein (TIGR00369 family)
VLFGEEFVEAGDGVVRWRYRVNQDHFNPAGALHGGVISALLDGVQGHALWTQIGPQGNFSAAITLNVHFLGATRQAGGTLAIEGRVLQVGKRVAFTEATATDDNGRVVARSTCTHAIMSG